MHRVRSRSTPPRLMRDHRLGLHRVVATDHDDAERLERVAARVLDQPLERSHGLLVALGEQVLSRFISQYEISIPEASRRVLVVRADRERRQVRRGRGVEVPARAWSRRRE